MSTRHRIDLDFPWHIESFVSLGQVVMQLFHNGIPQATCLGGETILYDFPNLVPEEIKREVEKENARIKHLLEEAV